MGRTSLNLPNFNHRATPPLPPRPQPRKRQTYGIPSERMQWLIVGFVIGLVVSFLRF